MKSILHFNLRQVEEADLAIKGDVAPEDLEIAGIDQLIHIRKPVRVDLTVQQMEGGILVRGRIEAELDCECGRCLKPFTRPLVIDPFGLHLALTGEDAVAVDNDSVDLTPFLREDILLGFPQHPLCEEDCDGLARKTASKANQTDPSTTETADPSSVWAALNKLKL
jgi:uncharacterized protein